MSAPPELDTECAWDTVPNVLADLNAWTGSRLNVGIDSITAGEEPTDDCFVTIRVPSNIARRLTLDTVVEARFFTGPLYATGGVVE